jgi:hypothetical protein
MASKGEILQLVRRFRIPALFCALSVLLCELISRPYAGIGICDDGPYILVAQKLAITGHVTYNGWSAAMLLWQLYLGAAFIKLFGFSFTIVRMSTLLVAVVLAFFLQRTLVRASISERNATIGTLALVLSPLYLMLSATFMSDIHGLFGIVLCLYGCLRALQAASTRAAVFWLCFAIATSGICGTSRQLAWLGVLVMVPSTLWLLRARRNVLLGGMAATLAGFLFILGCMLWLKHQPYILPEHFLSSTTRGGYLVHQFIHFFLDVPFLLLPIMVVFLPEIRKSRRLVIAVVVAMTLGYALLVTLQGHLHQRLMLEPTIGDWVTVAGGYGDVLGSPPIFLHLGVRILLTAASLGGLLGLLASLVRSDGLSLVKENSTGASWKELGVLLVPFTIVYMLLLISRAITIVSLTDSVVLDRYALGLLVVALVCLVRYYQERVQLQLPFAGILLVGIMAIYGVAVTHNMFSFYRARMAIAAELRDAAVPDTAIDHGWDYNLLVELKYAAYINDSEIENPAGAYVPTPPPPAGVCPTFWYDRTPHIKAVYGISYDPNECYGPAPFAPVHYSRWLARTPGTLYVVRYTAPSKP